MLDGAYTFRKDTGDTCGRILSNNIAQDVLHQGRRQGAKDYSLATSRYVVFKDYDLAIFNTSRATTLVAYVIVQRFFAYRSAGPEADNDLSTHRNRRKSAGSPTPSNSEIALGDDPRRSRLRYDGPDLEFAECLTEHQARQAHFTLHDTICARNSVRARERNKAACPKSRQSILTLAARSKERKSKLGTPSFLSTALRDPSEIIYLDNIKPIDESQDLGDYEDPQKISKYSLV
ncbi:hypothetical protein ARMSODRAFT_521227 [Armillaria solidipes]|uniref:Uncharacterized protein n=1 Tax=Armillaria solidipes TaxID=1076256 RepID=A0A2H3AYY9_9AGAR|nr:hypothetical protein ARMSODRAFT_521227 [Armillaria solidipes]